LDAAAGDVVRPGWCLGARPDGRPRGRRRRDHPPLQWDELDRADEPDDPGPRRRLGQRGGGRLRGGKGRDDPALQRIELERANERQYEPALRRLGERVNGRGRRRGWWDIASL